MEKGKGIANSIKENGSSSSLVPDSNWKSFPTPMKHEKGRSYKFLEVLDDDNKVMVDFMKTIKSNSKNSHQFTTLIRNDKEVKVIYTHPYYEEAVRGHRIMDVVEGKEISYQVAERILEET